MSRESVIEIAKSDLGYTESPPNSNMTKYGAWYGMNGVPWCVESLAYWFNKAGEGEAFYGGGKTASCGELLRWAKREGLTVPVAAVRAGDIVILDFSGTGDTQHCGLVVEAEANAGWSGWIRTIEGNTTPGAEGSQNNGGSVALKIRYPRQIVVVIRPKYKEEVKPDYAGHWAEASMNWAIDRGLLDGYEDGTYRPNQAVTRAELVTILKRYDDYRFGGTEK